LGPREKEGRKGKALIAGLKESPVRKRREPWNKREKENGN
jgi:hypothetical protein